MRLNRQQLLILYALGLCHEHFQKEFSGKPLGVTFSKSAFIELMMKSGITDIKDRALYKNLEFFEEHGLIEYVHKSVTLSKKGWKLFESLRKTVDPFVKIADTFRSQNISHYARKARAVLAV